MIHPSPKTPKNGIFNHNNIGMWVKIDHVSLKAQLLKNMHLEKSFFYFINISLEVMPEILCILALGKKLLIIFGSF